MALKVLPNDVRSILCASAQINNYKTAVQELVYNSLDAESTSIAIRIQIQENRIQVVDNGYGITKLDFDALGQRYMTSKCTDLSTFKSTPKCYGYRGEYLASIIEISGNVKIISRFKDSEETWAKTFHEGKKKSITKMNTRPSKGTTVEIRGFLYNLRIQKLGIDAINDLQQIKTFLEQLSLVHNNISLSLRDDSKNEIIFQIQKKRDIYQTLSTLFNIEKTTVQELQVEKNQYKVKAFIGKTDAEIGKHWVYLNGKFIPNNSKLHKIINECFKKHLLVKDKKKSKSKINHDEDHLFKQNIPLYFLFITCPYIDYDINTTLRQSVIEFQNWEQIKKMLEKLVKFYTGEVCLKEINKTVHKGAIQEECCKANNNTRDQIKKIIDKILGSNSKRLGVSQLQNNVKGKLIKRKNKKKTKNISPKKMSLQINRQTETEHNDVICIQDINIDHKNERNSMKSNNFNTVEENPVMQETPKTKKHKDKVIEPNLVKANNIVNNSKIKKNKQKNMSSDSVHQNMVTCKNKIKPKKTRKLKRNKHLDVVQFITETDSVSKKSRLVAQQVEDFLRHQNKYRMIEQKYADKRDTMNMLARNKYHTNCIRYNVGSNVMYKIKTNPFKTTYDLVQTILASQQGNEIQYTDISLENRFKHYPVLERRQTTISKNVIRKPLKYDLPVKRLLSENTNTDHEFELKSKYDSISRNLASYQLTRDNNASKSRYSELEYKGNLDNILPEASPQKSLRCEDLYKKQSDILNIQDDPSCFLSNLPTVSLLTYESHKNRPKLIETNHGNINTNKFINRAQKVRYITKQSRDNFIPAKEKFKSMFKHKITQQNNKRNNNKGYVRQMVDESYTIEFTKSNEISYSIVVSNQSNFSIHYANDDNQSICQIHTPNYEPTSGFGNTYTIPTYSISSDCNMYTQNQRKRTNSDELFVTDTNRVSYPSTKRKNKDLSAHNATVTKNNNYNSKDEVNIVFLPDSEVVLDEESRDIEPMHVCETILGTEDGSIANEFAFSFNGNHRLDDSLYNNFGEINHNIYNNEKYITQTIQKNNEDVSHHFSNTLTTKHIINVDNIQANIRAENIPEKVHTDEHNTQDLQNTNVQCNENIEHIHNTNSHHFDFKNRLRFLPKGMSQIFEKCGSKTICDYNMDQDYYEDTIYNDFANDVQIQTEIYEPAIQNVEEYTTKDIHKFKNKVQKDNTSLGFDEKSLKEAKVLNQVDCKFIAAIIKEKYSHSDNTSEYLVLFDQHAVHERIRLEQNLADYIKEDKWKSIALDNITLKITQDEILYLHNYKEKFMQLGLQWTIINKDELSISSIPEAILGKNPREVDKVMKAVKNLIVEEINVIKLQKGCISLYPKSIMDLVFSEACRYAIKFGDKLSKNECIDLLKDLSNCKTPFQCAHGRPVMAVLVDIKSDIPNYKINMDSLLRFKLNKKTTDL